MEEARKKQYVWQDFVKLFVWQDFVKLFLGIWAFLTPWFIGHYSAATVVANYVIVGILVTFCAGAALVAFRPWQEGINMVLGAWLLISPWWLEFRLPALIWSAVVIGVLLMLCSAMAVIKRDSHERAAK